MKLKLYQIDAFAEELFQGNPAAVVPLPYWPSDQTLQNIASENNLSETAFFVANAEKYDLRWFTPVSEIDLCGHATLATAYVIFSEFKVISSELIFLTRSGELRVRKENDVNEVNNVLAMDFPLIACEEFTIGKEFTWLLSIKKEFALSSKQDLILVLLNKESVVNFKPNALEISKLPFRGLIVTAQGTTEDFVSRCFYPEQAVIEDPVTGSAHCQLTSYWAKRLGKNRLTARQLSQRGGNLICELRGERVFISGKAIKYLTGEIDIDI
jgi:PhzF family phenazine biosynthesis protein